MKTVKNPRSQQPSWDREKETGHDEDPLPRRIYVGGVPHDMVDQDLFHFFNLKFGPRSHVEHAVVLVKKTEEWEGQPVRTNRYGFVTFTSRETVKKVLSADISQLTLSSGRTLAVGPAKRSHLSYNSYAGPDRREEGRGAARLKVQSKQEKSNLRVEAQDWRETRGYVETGSDTQSGQQEPSQEGQVYHYNLQHQQYLQYQQHLHYQQYLQYPEVNMIYPQPGYSSTYQDQLLFYPAYYDQTGVVWAQYPLVYPPYQVQQPQPEYEHQPRDSRQHDLLQDSGFYGYDVSSTSIVTGEMSQTSQYEDKDVSTNLGNVLQKQPDSADFRRPGWKVESPYRRYKPFSAENNILGQGKSGTNINKGENKKGKTDTDLGRIVKEPNNKGKEEIKEGRKTLGKKKVIIDKSEKLEDPFKKLSI